MIYNFQDFLFESELEKVLESGLISGKHDFSDLAKACDIFINVYDKHKQQNTQEEIEMFKVFINEKEVTMILSDNSDSIDIARFVPRTLLHPSRIYLYPGWVKIDSLTREIAIAHEFSHSIDPSITAGVDDVTSKRFFKFANVKNFDGLGRFLIKSFDDLSKGDPSDFYKVYMRQFTEVEAHVGMLVYAINAILLKDQSKLNELKALLSKGDWNVDEIFPQLKPIMDLCRDRMEPFGKVTNKLKKRLGALVSTIKAGEKIHFKLVIDKDNPYSPLADFYKDLKDKLVKEKLIDTEADFVPPHPGIGNRSVKPSNPDPEQFRTFMASKDL